MHAPSQPLQPAPHQRVYRTVMLPALRMALASYRVENLQRVVAKVGGRLGSQAETSEELGLCQEILAEMKIATKHATELEVRPQIAIALETGKSAHRQHRPKLKGLVVSLAMAVVAEVRGPDVNEAKQLADLLLDAWLVPQAPHTGTHQWSHCAERPEPTAGDGGAAARDAPGPEEPAGGDAEACAPPSRFRPPGTVLGAQHMFTAVNPYGKYFRGPDNIPGGRNRARRRAGEHGLRGPLRRRGARRHGGRAQAGQGRRD